MKNVIDSRVVEMRFDNKQFEAGAKQTMSTLEKLKTALKLPDASKSLAGLDKAAKTTKLDGLIAGVDALNKRFSTFGIVGMRVIQNITDNVMGRLSKAVNFVSDSIVSGGVRRAMNIENAHFQLQALLKDETKVQAVMADAMTSVDGTAYAYDEAAKAASMFAASGLEAGDQMLGALRGIAGTAAMTNSDYASMAMIFTTVAGQGRLMGDQLLQLASRGLNAASTLKDYFSEVLGYTDITETEIREMVTDSQISFELFAEAMNWAFGESAQRANETFTGSFSNIKSALARIGAGFISPLVEQNGELVKMFNAIRIKTNDVKAALVFDEQRSAINGLAEATGLETETISELFSIIKDEGSLSKANFNALNDSGINATKAIKKYINGVSNGSIRANYAMTSSIQTLTNGTKVSEKDVAKFVKKGKVDLAMFTSAMEKEFGKEKTLSKQFTDFVLDHVSKLTKAIEGSDVTKPMEAFYNVVDSVKNVFKALYSVASPIGKAFSDVFLSFKADSIVNVTKAISEFTSKLILSEGASKGLHDVAEGLFSVVKIGVDIFVGLLKAISPIGVAVLDVGKSFLGLIGVLGRVLSFFANGIRESEIFQGVLFGIGKTSEFVVGSISSFIRAIIDFMKKISELESVGIIVSSLGKIFNDLYYVGKKSLGSIGDLIKNMFSGLNDAGGVDINPLFDAISNGLTKLSVFVSNVAKTDIGENLSILLSEIANTINNFEIKDIGVMFENIGSKLKNLSVLLSTSDGFSTFIKNMSEFGEKVLDVFSFESLMNRVDGFMDVFRKFFSFVKEVIGPGFEEFSIGGSIAAGGGIGLIYSMVKAAKGLFNISLPFKNIGDVFSNVSGALEGFQRNMNATAILKIAGAIGILAASLALLTLVEPKNLLAAAVALTALTGVFLFGMTKMKEISTVSGQLQAVLKKVATGLTIKFLVDSLLKAVSAIILLGLALKLNPDGMNNAVKMVVAIGASVVAIMAVVGLIGKLFKGVSGGVIAGLGVGIAGLSLALILIVSSLGKLFKMEIPKDGTKKLIILGALIAELGILMIAAGASAKISGGNKVGILSLVGLAGVLSSVVNNFKKMLSMSLPKDWGTKMAIFTLLMMEVAALLVVIGKAGAQAQGKIKLTGVFLGLGGMITAIIGAFMTLSMVPWDKLTKGLVALGALFVGLAVVFSQVGKIQNEGAGKAVLGMVEIIGALTASLGVLAIIPLEGIAKGVISLGMLLLIMAKNFDSIGKITSNKAYLSVLAMTLVIGSIVGSLYVLAKFSWENVLTGAISLGLVISALGKAFTSIAKLQGNLTNIGAFLLMLIPLMAITESLKYLSNQPWQGMIAGAGSLSLVLLAMAESFKIISKSRFNPGIAEAFLVMLVPIAGIVIGIKALSKEPWQGMLVAAGAISELLFALTAVVMILSKMRVGFSSATNAAAGLSSFVVILTTVLTALGALFQKVSGLESMLDKGIQILIKLGKGIGEFVGSLISGLLTNISKSLPEIGKNLSKFGTNLQPFISSIKMLDSKSLANVGILSGVFLALGASAFINAIGKLFKISIVDVAKDLSKFGINLLPFIVSIKGIDQKAAKAVESIGKMILALTTAEMIQGVSRFFGFSGKFSDFGAELVSFAPNIKLFSTIVDGIKPKSVVGAATAASIMAETAKKLPGKGGKLQEWLGDKSLGIFAEELEAFGPAIASFAKTVENVKASAVKGAASAAKIMAEVENNLPAHGGILQEWIGDKSLAKFGAELVSFAPKISAFANAVNGIKASSVKGAANAAKLMVEVVNGLPKDGGFLQKFTGKKSIKKFGEDLETFGNALTGFSASVKGMSQASVGAAATAGKMLVEIAKALPKSQTIGQAVGGGGKKSLSDFGRELEPFGTSLTKFSDNLKGFNATVVKTAVSFIDKLAKAAKVDTTSFTEFVKGLSDLAEKGVEAFTKPLGDQAKAKVRVAVQKMVKEAETATTSEAESVAGSMKTAGEGIVNQFVKGLNNKLPEISSTGKNVVSGITSGISKYKGLGGEAGSDLAKNVDSGFRDFMKIQSPSKLMQNRAGQIVDGLNKGLDQNKSKAGKEAEKLAKFVAEKMDFNTAMKKAGTLKANETSLSQLAGIVNAFRDRIKNGTEKDFENLKGTGATILAVMQEQAEEQQAKQDEYDKAVIKAKLNRIKNLEKLNLEEADLHNMDKILEKAGTYKANEISLQKLSKISEAIKLKRITDGEESLSLLKGQGKLIAETMLEQLEEEKNLKEEKNKEFILLQLNRLKQMKKLSEEEQVVFQNELKEMDKTLSKQVNLSNITYKEFQKLTEALKMKKKRDGEESLEQLKGQGKLVAEVMQEQADERKRIREEETKLAIASKMHRIKEIEKLELEEQALFKKQLKEMDKTLGEEIYIASLSMKDWARITDAIKLKKKADGVESLNLLKGDGRIIAEVMQEQADERKRIADEEARQAVAIKLNRLKQMKKLSEEEQVVFNRELSMMDTILKEEYNFEITSYKQLESITDAIKLKKKVDGEESLEQLKGQGKLIAEVMLEQADEQKRIREEEQKEAIRIKLNRLKQLKKLTEEEQAMFKDNVKAMDDILGQELDLSTLSVDQWQKLTDAIKLKKKVDGEESLEQLKGQGKLVAEVILEQTEERKRIQEEATKEEIRIIQNRLKQRKKLSEEEKKIFDEEVKNMDDTLSKKLEMEKMSLEDWEKVAEALRLKKKRDGEESFEQFNGQNKVIADAYLAFENDKKQIRDEAEAEEAKTNIRRAEQRRKLSKEEKADFDREIKFMEETLSKKIDISKMSLEDYEKYTEALKIKRNRDGEESLENIKGQGKLIYEALKDQEEEKEKLLDESRIAQAKIDAKRIELRKTMSKEEKKIFDEDVRIMDDRLSKKYDLAKISLDGFIDLVGLLAEKVAVDGWDAAKELEGSVGFMAQVMDEFRQEELREEEEFYKKKARVQYNQAKAIEKYGITTDDIKRIDLVIKKLSAKDLKDMTQEELALYREAVKRGLEYGGDAWYDGLDDQTKIIADGLKKQKQEQDDAQTKMFQDNMEKRDKELKAIEKFGYTEAGLLNLNAILDKYGVYKANELATTQMAEYGEALVLAAEIYGEDYITTLGDTAVQIYNLEKRSSDDLKKLEDEDLDYKWRRLAESKELQKDGLDNEEIFFGNLLSIKEKGYDGAQYKEMSYYDFRKKLLDDSRELIDDYVEANKKAFDEIYSAYDIFNELPEKTQYTMEKANKNAADQIANAKNYRNNIQKILSDDIYKGTDIWEFVKNSTIADADKIAFYASASDAEKKKLIADAKEYADIAQETADIMTAPDKENARKDFAEKMGLNLDASQFDQLLDWINKGHDVESSLRVITKNFDPSFYSFKTVEDSGYNLSTAFSTGVRDGMYDGMNNLQDYSTKTMTEIANVVGVSSRDIISDTANYFVSEGKGTASSFIDNLSSNFYTLSPIAALAASTLGSSVVDAIKNNTGSEQTTEIGVDLGNGLVNGMTSTSQNVKNSAENVGSSITDILDDELPASKFWNLGNGASMNLSSGITGGLPNVTDSASRTSGVVTNTMSNQLPGSTFWNLGNNASTNMATGILSKYGFIKDTSSGAASNCLDPIQNTLTASKFGNIGTTAIGGMTGAILSQYGFMNNTSTDLAVNNCYNPISNNLSATAFRAMGMNIPTNIANGIRSNLYGVNDAASKIGQDVINKLVDKFNSAYQLGVDFVFGLKLGMLDKRNDLYDTVVDMAKKTLEKMKKGLDEKSPSKATREMGVYFTEGLRLGILDKAKSVGDATSKVSNIAFNALSSVNDAIKEQLNGSLDMEPVVRPVLDLSDVTDGARLLSSMMNQTYDLSVMYDNVQAAASTFNKTNNSKSNNISTDNQEKPTETKYEFNQYNYSPKALTRSEIYRQTNNQFSSFRRAVNPV